MTMPTIEVFKLPVNKSDLDKAPEKERFLYLHLGQVANDINLAHRDLLVALNTNTKYEPELAVSANTIAKATHLAGKLYEAWELFRGNSAIRAPCDEIEEFRQSWKFISRYFGNGSLIAEIRNKVAFHNDPHLAAKAYARLSEFSCAELVTEHRGGCLFDSAHALTVSMIAEIAGEPDVAKAVDRLMGDLITIAAKFNDLIYAYTSRFLDKHVWVGQPPVYETVTIEAPPSLDEVSIPFFLLAQKAAWGADNSG